MTRQAPDDIELDVGVYSLYPGLSLLPAGHPRWEYCEFSRSTSTANYRGYIARWAIAGGQLYLQRFSGEAEDGFGPSVKSKRPKQMIGMLDVHEVDTPVPAFWISCDLYCPSGKIPGISWTDFIPETFLLFRIVRGRVVAHTTVPNTGEEVDENYDGATALLDRFIKGGGADAQKIVAGPLEGLAEALHNPGHAVAHRHLADLLWHAGSADLDALVPALTSVQESDILRWIGYALNRIGPDAAVAITDLMTVLASTDDTEVARAMAYALAGIGPAAAPVFPSVIPLVLDRCGQQADRQLELFVDNLEPYGPEVIDLLIAGMLSARETNVANHIAFALGRIGLSAVLPLYGALANAEDDRQRSMVARALGRIGPDAGMALDLLLDRLRQAGDDDARSTMMDAVTKIGLRSPADLHVLRAVFRNTDDTFVLRRTAAAAATLGSGTLAFLLEEFEAGSPAARVAIVKQIGDFGTEAAAAVDAFALAAESSPDRALLDALTQVLAKIGAPADVLFAARIRALLHVPGGYWADDGLTGMQMALDAGLRLPEHQVLNLVSALIRFGGSYGRPIARMLGSIGKPAAAPLLRALDQVQDPDTRNLIFFALGLIGEPGQAAIDDVVVALSAADNDPLRLQLVDDLIRLGQPNERHMATLVDVLIRSSFRPIWWRLGIVLAGYGAPAVVTLVQILEHATDDGLCTAMENALLEVVSRDAAARTDLLSALKHVNRKRAKIAIQMALSQA